MNQDLNNALLFLKAFKRPTNSNQKNIFIRIAKQNVPSKQLQDIETRKKLHKLYKQWRQSLDGQQMQELLLTKKTKPKKENQLSPVEQVRHKVKKRKLMILKKKLARLIQSTMLIG